MWTLSLANARRWLRALLVTGIVVAGSFCGAESLIVLIKIISTSFVSILIMFGWAFAAFAIFCFAGWVHVLLLDDDEPEEEEDDTVDFKIVHVNFEKNK